ncbi:hypothetical protein CHH67_21115 [Paenibacillus campinasensis]|uniref:Uncharacterized protein n=1 Tax=Paenibacillus campinasensis TaxID=66347 RepID=A0A268EI62_9BACL|nr:hypothetical protein CHH67_21115 [Paenibacillus campinasensis]
MLTFATIMTGIIHALIFIERHPMLQALVEFLLWKIWNWIKQRFRKRKASPIQKGSPRFRNRRLPRKRIRNHHKRKFKK